MGLVAVVMVGVNFCCVWVWWLILSMGLVAIVVVGVDFGWALVDLVSFDYGGCDGGLWVAGMATSWSWLEVL